MKRQHTKLQLVPLDKTGEIFVQKSQLGGGSPMMKGFSANRILLSLDGIRLNNIIYRGGNIHNIISIDPNILDGVEFYLVLPQLFTVAMQLVGVLTFELKTLHLKLKDW